MASAAMAAMTPARMYRTIMVLVAVVMVLAALSLAQVDASLYRPDGLRHLVAEESDSHTPHQPMPMQNNVDSAMMQTRTEAWNGNENESEEESQSEADVDADSDADVDADEETDLDRSLDPAGHSPFRVRHAAVDGETGDESSEHADQHAQKATTLIEHVAAHPANTRIDIPLTRATVKPEVHDAVLMEVRSRQEASSEDHAAFIALSEGMDHDAMERQAHLQAEAVDAFDREGDFSALEIRSSDVPLYQEVLKEKHLATYYGTLGIGDSSKSRVFRVLFDTGSCELWIPSDACTTARCMRHKRFPMSAAEGKRFGRGMMSIEYISGKVAGPLIRADVKVGDLTVPNQILGLAKTLDIELLDEVVWDGIVGLAYPTRGLVSKGVTPLMDNIIKQRLLTNAKPKLANQFAYYIDDHHGQMTFGGVNCEYVVRNSDALSAEKRGTAVEKKAIQQCKKSFQFVPVTRKSYWTLTLDDVSLEYPKGVKPPAGQKLRGFCGTQGCRALVDTGTYLLYTSKFFRTPAAWTAFKHCGDTSKLPNIIFHFRTGPTAASPLVSLSLAPRDYILKFHTSKSPEDCVVGISPDQDNVFTLGQVFLRAYYALFDRDENRIGFSRIHRKGHEAINAKPSKTPPMELLLD